MKSGTMGITLVNAKSINLVYLTEMCSKLQKNLHYLIQINMLKVPLDEPFISVLNSILGANNDIGHRYLQHISIVVTYYI